MSVFKCADEEDSVWIITAAVQPAPGNRRRVRGKQREKESERRKRRRSEVGGVWLPSTSSLASSPFGLSHLFFFTGYKDTHQEAHRADLRSHPG